VAETDRSKFLVGSLSLRHENEVRAILTSFFIFVITHLSTSFFLCSPGIAAWNHYGLKKKIAYILPLELQVHLLDFDDESYEIQSYIYRHPAGEVWSIAPCPSRPDLFFTCYNHGQFQFHLFSVACASLKAPGETFLFFWDFAVGEASTEMKASLWQTKEVSDKTKDLTLEHLVTLPDHSEKLQG